MSAYYNEFDPYCVEWLKNLIKAGHIPAGDVDDRSICEVQGADLKGYTQCHFFAGLGGWGAALRIARWPDDQPVWTGSCPCQPFSVAGKQKGIADERHLWPEWFRLIRECRPSVVFGEQVASAKVWLDGVYSDMEAAGYAVGSAVLPACAVNAPHRRERLWFVAQSQSPREWRGGLQGSSQSASTHHERAPSESSGSGHRMWPTPHSNASTGAGKQGRDGGGQLADRSRSGPRRQA